MSLVPFIDDPDFHLYVGDALDVLRKLPQASVHTCVTSPPYWGLRDYGTGGQLGLEPTPQGYVERLVEIFREVRRVLRPDGTVWLNLGDTYAQGSKGNSGELRPGDKQATNVGGLATRRGESLGPNRTGGTKGFCKPKDLVGIPWRVAFALQDDGWYLRSDIIWSKTNPMPEPVLDRPTKSHEYVFLLARSSRYFYDMDAVREPHAEVSFERIKARSKYAADNPDRPDVPYAMQSPPTLHEGGRNRRSVWEIATESYAAAHFATFPTALIEPCIKAGTSEVGCCSTCGAPWEREAETKIDESRPPARRNINEPQVTQAGQGTNARGSSTWGHWTRRETVGWHPTCSHNTAAVPCVVLDPFMGSGTTALVARTLGRHAVGIELNEDYARLAAERTKQLSLFAEAG